MKKLFKNYRRFTTVTFAILFSLGLIMIAFLQNYTPSPTSSVFLDDLFFNYLSEPTNVLLLGGDATSGSTDTMMVINVNPNTSELSILSIPRDTKVSVGNWTGKINAVYAIHGANTVMDTVGNLLDIKIENYARIDLAVFRKVIDSLGGVQFDVPVELFYRDKSQGLFIDLKKGPQLLNGDKSEQLMRFRQWGGDPGAPKAPPELSDFYNGGDLTRINMQQKFIREVISQKLVLQNISKFGEILSAVFENLKTDLSMNSILKPSPNFINKFKSSNIYSFKLNGPDGREYAGGPWYFFYNDTLFDTNSEDNKPIEAESILQKHFQCDNWYTDAKVNKTIKKGTKSTPKPTSNIKSTPRPIPTLYVTNTENPYDPDDIINPVESIMPTESIEPTDSPKPTQTDNGATQSPKPTVSPKPTISPKPTTTEKPVVTQPNDETNDD